MSQRSKLATIVGTAGAVTVASLVAVFLMGRAAISANGDLIHYHVVIGGLQETLSTLKDAETGQCGHLLRAKSNIFSPTMVLAVLASLIAPAALMGAPRWLPAIAITLAVVIRHGGFNTGVGQWLADRPLLATFRRARVSHYGRLMALRVADLPSAGPGALSRNAKLRPTCTARVCLLVHSCAHIAKFASVRAGRNWSTASGDHIRSGRFGSKADLLAMSLTHSFGSILFRAPLVLFKAPYVRRVFPARSS
jgi:hypothetical protein